MKCPSCEANNPDGQKFCGTCGHKLAAVCPKCQATNPPGYKFCGQCGAAVTTTGNITLARSGLILQIDETALAFLGYAEAEMRGKPFSLFIEREDLVIFFTNLNELTSSAQAKSFELSLKHKQKNSIYGLLEGRTEKDSSGAIETIHLNLSKAANHRQTAVQLQTQQNLLGLIFTATHNISTAGKKHLARSIEDTLKKVCLFTKADVTVIWGINRPAKHLEPLYQWHRTAKDASHGTRKIKSVALSRIKPIVMKLRQEKIMVIDQLTDLEPREQEAWRAWHQDDVNGIICFMMYSGKMPVGMISAARKTTTDEVWSTESKALLQFIGNFLSTWLPYPVLNRRTNDRVSSTPRNASGTLNSAVAQTEALPAIDIPLPKVPGETADLTAEDSWQLLPEINRPMLFDRYTGDTPREQQTVFPRDDGLTLITCPRCGRQDTIPLEQFDTLGNAIAVDCPCKQKFTAVLEKRRAFRKQVHLSGYFTVGEDSGDAPLQESFWGQMVVVDLSKNGLRFTTEKAELLRPGEILTVRFNLDNSNQSPINKTARIISINGYAVGCQFEGADSYDITLGFYFI